ncbi:MAG: LPS export ABC transporter periplasmic protein LptC [Gammaproteobacteria bacterium]
MIQRLIMLALLLAAAVGSAWLLKELTTDGTVADAAQYHDPDYYLEDFTTVTMADDGTPKHRLHAKYLAHYPDDDSNEILQPTMEIFRDNKQPLYIAAETGWITGDNEVLVLQGDVRLWEHDPEGGYALQVDTSEVTILLKDEYAETDKHTTITTNSSIVTGTGMRAFLSESRVEIINHDKTTIKIEPKG